MGGGGAGPDRGAPIAVAAPDLSPELDAVLHILIRCPALRPLAFDQLGLEPSHFPAAYRPIVERLLIEPDCHADSLLLMGEEPELLPLKPALFRWVTRDLAERGAAGIPAGQEEANLRGSLDQLRIKQLQDELHRIGLAIRDAERRRDFAEVRRLGAEKLAVGQRIADLRGLSGA